MREGTIDLPGNVTQSCHKDESNKNILCHSFVSLLYAGKGREKCFFSLPLQPSNKDDIMEIKKSAFVLSAPLVSMCPKDDKAEYAFIGRSNVGKSSLINMLCQHKGLAKTSSTPGKTLLINHFLINDAWYLVDLPGYGFARRSKSVQKQLQQMISGYILQRKQLVNLFILIDIRHEQQKIDREFIDWLGESGVPFAIVFTKADKLGPVKARQNAEQWMKQLEDVWEELPPYFITSAEKKTGREDLLAYIDDVNQQLEAE